MAKQITKTVFLLRNLEHGYECVHQSDFSTGFPGKYLVLAKQDVAFDLLMSDSEMTAAAVACLQKEIVSLRAETQAKVNLIEEHIQSLLSITHQPGERA
jgi:hypothetical protein